MSLIGAAAIGAGASLLGNILGSSSQKKANETNLKINQMNNEFNERMMDKQIAYEKEMWNANNEYNSAASQAERWREAGMNPSLMMGNANAGIASSGSVSAASAAPSSSQQAFNPDFSGFSNAANFFVDAAMRQKQIDSDIQFKDVQKDVMEAEAYAKIGKLMAETEDVRIKNLYAHQLYRMTLDNMNADLRTKEVDSAYKEAQTKYTISQELLLSKELSVFDEKHRMTMSLNAADLGLKVVQKSLTLQQAEHEYQKMMKTAAETTGIKLNNGIIVATSRDVILKAYHDAQRAAQPQNLWQGGHDAIQGFNTYMEDQFNNAKKYGSKLWKKMTRGFHLPKR